MNLKYRKAYQLLAVVLVLAVTAETFLFYTGKVGGPRESADAKASYNGDDQQIVADISNMTGVDTRRIMNLKASGKTWNEVLDSLKNTGTEQASSDKAKRGLNLLEQGLGEEAVKRLEAMGFEEKDIMHAKLLAERTAQQMQQLLEETNPGAPKAPSAPAAAQSGDPAREQEAFLAELRPVAEQFDLESAVRFMLSFNSEFGSYEAVLDEYLLALQLGLNLEQYKTNKAQYLKDKEQKKIGKTNTIEITLNELETRLLEKIKRDNESEREAASSVTPTNPASLVDTKEAESNPLPEMPLPEIKDVKPVNPADALRQELKSIDPNNPVSG